MSGLNNLKVSLTKNGFHKVADVIIKHPRQEVLDNIRGTYPDISLDRGQISNMLSCDQNTDELPEFWDEIRTYGEKQVRALVFISILFSHADLIKAFANAATGEMRGTLRRGAIGDKAYTNIAYTMQSFGICNLKHGAPEVDYSVQIIFSDMKIGPLAKQVIYSKLKQTGWNEPSPTDEFRRNFYEQCRYYKFNDALALTSQQFEDWLEGNVVETSAPVELALPSANVVVSAQLVAALSAKPFVILCGASGTGKTTSIRQLVAALSPVGVDRQTNHAFIAVEAGWTDGRHLLGYRNPFGKDGEYYTWTPVVEVLLRANYPDYSTIPFFIVLDEMNLSYVEMYFSRFLSMMETSFSGNPEPLIDRETLKLMLRSGMLDPEHASMAERAISNGGLFLSKNVFIVGTVNVDETTHSFSPKVLDRAFVIEVTCDAPSLHSPAYQIREEDRFELLPEECAALLIRGEEAALNEETFFIEILDSLFSKLGVFKFGPRVTKEIKKYITVSKSIETKSGVPNNFSLNYNIVDRFLMQKVLPKLNGNRAQLGKVIEELLSLPYIGDLPMTMQKLGSMKNSLGPLGVVNFFS